MIVREWEEELKSRRILGIITDEPNENAFLNEQKSEIIIGTEDATLYIGNDEYVKIEEDNVTRLSKDDAVEEYKKLLGWYQERGYTQISELIELMEGEQWNLMSTDKRISTIKRFIQDIKKKSNKEVDGR